MKLNVWCVCVCIDSKAIRIPQKKRKVNKDDPNPMSIDVETFLDPETGEVVHGDVMVRWETRKMHTLSLAGQLIYMVMCPYDFEQFDFTFAKNPFPENRECKVFNDCEYVRDHKAWDEGSIMFFPDGQKLLPGTVMLNLRSDELWMYIDYEQRFNKYFLDLDKELVQPSEYKNYPHGMSDLMMMVWGDAHVMTDVGRREWTRHFYEIEKN